MPTRTNRLDDEPTIVAANGSSPQKKTKASKGGVISGADADADGGTLTNETAKATTTKGNNSKNGSRQKDSKQDPPTTTTTTTTKSTLRRKGVARTHSATSDAKSSSGSQTKKKVVFRNKSMPLSPKHTSKKKKSNGGSASKSSPASSPTSSTTTTTTATTTTTTSSTQKKKVGRAKSASSATPEVAKKTSLKKSQSSGDKLSAKGSGKTASKKVDDKHKLSGSKNVPMGPFDKADEGSALDSPSKPASGKFTNQYLSAIQKNALTNKSGPKSPPSKSTTNQNGDSGTSASSPKNNSSTTRSKQQGKATRNLSPKRSSKMDPPAMAPFTPNRTDKVAARIISNDPMNSINLSDPSTPSRRRNTVSSSLPSTPASLPGINTPTRRRTTLSSSVTPHRSHRLSVAAKIAAQETNGGLKSMVKDLPLVPPPSSYARTSYQGFNPISPSISNATTSVATRRRPASPHRVRTASSSRSASPHGMRSSVIERLAAQEQYQQNQYNKKQFPVKAGRILSENEKPGAYSVRDDTAVTIPSGSVATMQRQTQTQTPASVPVPAPTSSSAPNAAVTSIPSASVTVASGTVPSPNRFRQNYDLTSASTSNLVVAAEVSADVEESIEQEVQRRIKARTTRADVVSMVHGTAPLYNPIEESRRIADLKELHKPKGVKEKLFGDARTGDVDIAASPESIRKRNYLQWTVKRNNATSLWVASVYTNQRAIEMDEQVESEKAVISFTAKTQEEAFEIGLANACPLLQPQDEYPICFICKTKFALFRRSSHCRNCGICVCASCSTTWPARMVPDTYNNVKNSTLLNVCVACDWLARAFREALLEGSYKRALYLYATGNVNLRNPFCLDKKTEEMYPIHLAILGGSLKLLRWLTEERYCPLREIKKRSSKKVGSPIVTSRGRSTLSIALLHQKLDIVRYLIVDRGLSLFEERDLNNDNNSSSQLALANFTSLLKLIPKDFLDDKDIEPTPVPRRFTQQQQEMFSQSLSTDFFMTDR